MKVIKNRFGERLKELREEKGFSQKELASELGFSQPTINRWEKGEREPNLSIFLAICVYFGVSSDYLLGLKEF